MGLFPRGQIARTPSHRRREAIATVLRGSSTIVFLALLLLIPGPSVSAGAPPIVRGHASPMGGSDWTNMNPGTAPSASVNRAMVYDSSADRMIVFGGYDGSPQGSDRTWAYDFESNTWTDLAPAVHPPAGWLDRAAYDLWAERMILFGGYDGVAGALSNQTWAFNFQANAWTNLQPARHPSARSRQGMAFDAQSDRTILFGGLTAEGVYSSETWAYRIDGNSWANMTSEVRPPGRRSPGMVYDAAAGRILLFGGYDSSSGIVYNDTWAYDFESNSWTKRNPPAPPSPRFGMGLAYDARLDRSILFGGAEGGDNVTWAYDFTNNSWAVLSTAHSPPTHAFHGMDYDVQSARTIMFGGGLGNPGNDTWALQTSPPVPLAPENLTATAGNGTVSLRWDPPAGNGPSPVAHRVYRGPDVDHLSDLADLGALRPSVDANVTNGVAYVYRVSATNANGEGALSSPVTATPDDRHGSADLSGDPHRVRLGRLLVPVERDRLVRRLGRDQRRRLDRVPGRLRGLAGLRCALRRPRRDARHRVVRDRRRWKSGGDLPGFVWRGCRGAGDGCDTLRSPG